jgi:hypothetical protein
MGPPEGGVGDSLLLVGYIGISGSELFDIKLPDSRQLKADVPKEFGIVS